MGDTSDIIQTDPDAEKAWISSGKLGFRLGHVSHIDLRINRPCDDIVDACLTVTLHTGVKVVCEERLHNTTYPQLPWLLYQMLSRGAWTKWLFDPKYVDTLKFYDRIWNDDDKKNGPEEEATDMKDREDQ